MNGEDKNKGVVDKAEEDARGQSTFPERFKYLTKEAPEKPVRWPWFVALAFLLYAWRTVLWELYNWRKGTATLGYLLVYISKLVLALIFHFIGNPITSIIRAFETMLYSIRAFYSSVVSYTPVSELTILIILVSTVLAIAEASVPDSVESQPYLFSLAGIIGYAAVKGSISELLFWTLLFCLFTFARFVKKRDYVSSALPVVAVLAGVGEPWVRFVVMSSFLALAITQRAKMPIEDGEIEDADKTRKVPVPLLFAGLAIGVRVAAKWVGYRHLTWMVV